MKKFKRLFCLLLAVCLITGCLPLAASAASFTTKNNMQGSDFATGALAARLDVVFRSGISGCVSPSLPAVGGTLNTSTQYTVTHEKLKGTTWRGKQCMAYAYAAYSYLFGYKCGNASDSYYNKVIPEAKAKKAVSYSQFQNWGVKCGTYMRTTANSDGSYNASKGHSIIILKYDSSGIYTLEGNYSSGKIGILYYTWNQFNSYTFTGKGRCVCAMTKPTESVYSSISYPSTPAPAPVGKTSKPSVSVNGQTVTVSWSYSGSAEYIDVCLIKEPWGWFDIVETKSTTGSSCTFYNVSPGYYQIFTIARPNSDKTQSEWTPFTVQAAHTTHTWDGGKVTKPATETSTGVKTYTCTVCGATKTETIAKLSHTTHKWDNGKVTKEATLTATGVKTYTCTVCGTTKTTEIPKLTSISGSCGTNIKWNYNGNTKILYISGKGKMPNYNDNPEIPWKACMVDLKKVEIENGITSIGANSFYPSPNLTSVSIPSSITEIGHDAFLGCKSLVNVQLPQGLKSIGDFAFAECAQLSSIEIPESVTALGKGVFSACSSLKSVSINCTLERIDKYTFKRCSSLVKIEIPEGVSHIEEQAFLECKSLQTIMLPSTISIIYSAVFQECTNLHDIYYNGSELDWKGVLVSLDGNTNFTSADFHYTKEEDEAGKVLFTDVPANAYYAQPVAWAVENNITGGTDKTHFSPSASCTRAQAVTFLWNAANRPEPQGSGNQFIDVKPGSYYEKAVQWAVENNITGGTDSTHFSPGETCTRAQIVTFLYHAASSPAVSGSGSFNDVKSGSYYENAVKWAVENGITSGTGNGKFSPYDNCVRGQIVTFLYRHAQG